MLYALLVKYIRVEKIQQRKKVKIIMLIKTRVLLGLGNIDQR